MNNGNLSLELPPYYKAYIESKATRIKHLIQSCASEGDIFIFITDEHWSSNQKNSLPLISYLEKNVNIPRLFSGGDEEDGHDGDFCKAISKAFHGRIYHAVGNHEYKNSTTGSQLYYDFDIFNNDQIGNMDRHYYYVNNYQQKIRYIVLNFFGLKETKPNTIQPYDQEQLDWLKNHALNVETGWTILIITHMLYKIIKAEDKWGISLIAEDCMRILDEYNGNGTIAAIIQGHTHRDRIAMTKTGIPIIITTCDKNIIARTDNFIDIRVVRPTGTIREQAFDVIILNKKEKTITAVRVGCPASCYDSEAETEERVVHYK